MTTSSKETLKKLYRKIPFGFFPYIILFSVLFVSLYTEFRTGESWMYNNYPHLTCPPFLRAPVILETIKILGLSTILIGVIYSSLDKQMLGLSYSELLQFRFISYHPCSVAHILATVLCIITSAAGISESAIITLIAVLYGFLYQWIAIYSVVLNSQKSEKIAVSKWEESLGQTERSLDNLLRLSGTIPPPDSKHFAKHLHCLAIAFTNHARQACTPVLLQQIADVWTTIHELSESQNHALIITSIFEELIKDENRFKQGRIRRWINKLCRSSRNQHNDNEIKEKALHSIGCGYLIQRILFSSSSETYKKRNSDVFLELSCDLAFLSRSITNAKQANISTMKSTLNCIKTNYSVLIWVYFQCGLIDLHPDMLALKPECVVDDCVYDVVNCLLPPVDSDMRSELKELTDRALYYLR